VASGSSEGEADGPDSPDSPDGPGGLGATRGGSDGPDGPPTGALDPIAVLVRDVDFDVRDDDERALGGQPARHAAADSHRATGHDGDPSVQPIHRI